MAGAAATATATLQDDSVLLTNLAKALRGIDEKATLRVTVTAINNKTYKTSFQVVRTSSDILVENDCIKFIVLSNGDVRSEIHANTRDPPCFEDRLTSNARKAANRITTTDILQVLKLKLLLACPFVKRSSIEIDDAAIRGRVRLTPFRLLRGQTALYEKYGYSNPYIVDIRKYIAGLHVKDVAPFTYKNPDSPDYDKKGFSEILMEKIGGNAEAAKEMPLVEAMKKITFDAENDRTQLVEFSEQLFDHVTLEEFPDEDLFTFFFQPDSEEWNTWKQKIVLTEFAVMPATRGGGRGRRGSRKRRGRKANPTRKHAK